MQVIYDGRKVQVWEFVSQGLNIGKWSTGKHCDGVAVRVWNGLDQSTGFLIQSSPGGSGLNWIRKLPTWRILDWTGSINVQCVSHFLDLRQFLLIVSNPDVKSSTLKYQLYLHSFVLTCIFYKVFGGFLLCCVWIELDWIPFQGHQLDWTGLGSMDRGFGLDWILATQSIPYSGCCCKKRENHYLSRRFNVPFL